MSARKKSSKSPTARTMEAVRELGFEVGRTESFNTHIGPFGKRQDLFGIFDLLCFDATSTLGIQCGTGSGHRAHRNTIMENELAPLWLAHPSRRIQIWSWRKIKRVRGGKQEIWAPRVEEILLEDFG